MTASMPNAKEEGDSSALVQAIFLFVKSIPCNYSSKFPLADSKHFFRMLSIILFVVLAVIHLWVLWGGKV